MRTIISHSLFRCDVCDKEEHVDSILALPEKWNTITVGDKKYDVCEECFNQIDILIKSLVRNKEHPCISCNIGWATISTNNYDSCERLYNNLKEYNEKIMKKYSK